MLFGCWDSRASFFASSYCFSGSQSPFSYWSRVKLRSAPFWQLTSLPQLLPQVSLALILTWTGRFWEITSYILLRWFLLLAKKALTRTFILCIQCYVWQELQLGGELIDLLSWRWLIVWLRFPLGKLTSQYIFPDSSWRASPLRILDCLVIPGSHFSCYLI